MRQPSSVFRGVVDVVENLEKLVDVGCITKADLVRFQTQLNSTFSDTTQQYVFRHISSYVFNTQLLSFGSAQTVAGVASRVRWSS
jgi:hypothetical protein